eukprot:6490529-Amphidinium_carterae.2
MWQYEDDVTKYNVKDWLGMNKEINQMINKKSFTEVGASMLNPAAMVEESLNTSMTRTCRPCDS